MIDIMLTADGDLSVSASGDISINDGVCQAVRIRLLWIFGEWKFAPEYGIPYFEYMLVKNPDIELIRRIVRDGAMSVDKVADVRNIGIEIDKRLRTLFITLEIITDDNTYREGVLVYAGLWDNAAGRSDQTA